MIEINYEKLSELSIADLKSAWDFYHNLFFHEQNKGKEKNYEEKMTIIESEFTKRMSNIFID